PVSTLIYTLSLHDALPIYDDKTVTQGQYAHEKQQSIGSWWSPKMDGLVYVDSGKVISVSERHRQMGTGFYMNFSERDILKKMKGKDEGFDLKIQDMVDTRLNDLETLGFEVK